MRNETMAGNEKRVRLGRMYFLHLLPDKQIRFDGGKWLEQSGKEWYTDTIDQSAFAREGLPHV